MHLPADITRCTGNSGKAEDDFALCPLRNSCARFTDYFATHLPANYPVPRMYAPNDCALFIEAQHYVPADPLQALDHIAVT
jgi:hypothetical protein